MSYEMYINCKCYQQGKSKPASSELASLLTIHEDGSIDIDEDIATEEEIDLFFDYIHTKGGICDHEYQQYYDIGLYKHKGLLHDLEKYYPDQFPLLIKHLPRSNEGYVPFEETQSFIDELKKISILAPIKRVGLVPLVDDFPLQGTEYDLGERDSLELYSDEDVELVLKDDGIHVHDKKLRKGEFLFDIVKSLGIFDGNIYVRKPFYHITTQFNIKLKGGTNLEFRTKFHGYKYNHEIFDYHIHKYYKDVIERMIETFTIALNYGNPVCWG